MTKQDAYMVIRLLRKYAKAVGWRLAYTGYWLASEDGTPRLVRRLLDQY